MAVPPTPEDFRQAFRGFRLLGGQDVTVDLHRERHLGVAESFTDDVRRDARRQ